MHKPAQVELQLDRPQLPYSEILGPIIAGGSPTHYRRRQPNPTKKGPYNYIRLQSLNGNDYTSFNFLIILGKGFNFQYQDRLPENHS